jgi:hypothetical protein
MVLENLFIARIINLPKAIKQKFAILSYIGIIKIFLEMYCYANELKSHERIEAIASDKRMRIFAILLKTAENNFLML